MQLGRIIGSIVATRKIERLHGVRLVMMEPLNSEQQVSGPPVAAIDIVHAGRGEVVFWVGSMEAGMAIDPPFPAVDVAVVGIVDRVDLLKNRAKAAR